MPIAGQPEGTTQAYPAVGGGPDAQAPVQAADDRVSRLVKRSMAIRAFWALSILDVGLIIGAIASPDIGARIAKVETVIITVNTAWASIVGAYMGFSFAAQTVWRRNNATRF